MTKLFKIFLILILIIAIALIYVAVFCKELLIDSDIQTIVGCLAVIAAVFSTWGALRVIDLAVENNRPLLMVNANFERYILIQIELKNVGRTIAKNISFKWTNSPKDEGKDDVFPETEIIRYVAPQEIVVRNLGRGFAFPEGYNLLFEGTMTYYDMKNKKYHELVVVDLSKYMRSMTVRSEKENFYVELSTLPEKIMSLERAITNKKFIVENNEMLDRTTIMNKIEKPD